MNTFVHKHVLAMFHTVAVFIHVNDLRSMQNEIQDSHCDMTPSVPNNYPYRLGFLFEIKIKEENILPSPKEEWTWMTRENLWGFVYGC